MTQLNDFIQSVSYDELQSISKQLKKYKVPRKDYFSSVEQLMYVTPENILLEVAPVEYHDFIQSDLFYKKIRPLADMIWSNSPEIPRIIDCRGVFYVSSCHLKIVHENVSNKDDIQYLKKLRAIKTTNETKELARVIDYKNIFSTSVIKHGGRKYQFSVFMCHAVDELKKYYEKTGNDEYLKIVSKLH